MKLTNKQKNWLQVLAVILMIAVVCSGCNSKQTTNNKIDSVSVDTSSTDTIVNKYSLDAEYFENAREINITLDSLEQMKDSIKVLNLKLTKVIKTKDSINRINITNKEKLGVAEYKLLRIREYNRIAAQGNNIKFLRGWINRVINH